MVKTGCQISLSDGSECGDELVLGKCRECRVRMCAKHLYDLEFNLFSKQRAKATCETCYEAAVDI